MNSVDDVTALDLINIKDETGMLVVAEAGKQIPIDFKRLFVVSGETHITRGRHAHKELTQVLICVNGRCHVVCDDGKTKIENTLQPSGKALLIPPGIWSEQTYVSPETVLVVLCDLPYDETDYIRVYDEFLKFRKSNR